LPKQILIADDNSAVRRIIRGFFDDRADIAVCGEAVDGLQAVEKAKALRPDLIVLDLVMPQMNGAEAASVLKKAMPEVPILLFTMHADNIGRYLTGSKEKAIRQAFSDNQPPVRRERKLAVPHCTTSRSRPEDRLRVPYYPRNNHFLFVIREVHRATLTAELFLPGTRRLLQASANPWGQSEPHRIRLNRIPADQFVRL